MRRDISGWDVRIDDALIAQNSASGVWRDQTIFDLAEELVLVDPDRITHVFEGKAWSIGAIVDGAKSLAAGLYALGLRSGDVVSFQLPNWVEAIVIDLAASMLGLVVAPIVPIYRDAEVAYMLADSGAKLAFVPGQYRGYDYLAMMHRVAPTLPKLKFVSSVRLKNDDELSYEALSAGRKQLNNPPKVDPNSVKMILYTSGTTGRPKGVLHSHNTMSYTVRRAMEHWGLTPGDSMLMASPVTHITGFGSGLELPLLCGVRTVFMDRWDAASGITLIESEHISISMGATPFLQELVAEAERRNAKLPSLRIYVCGGAAVPPNLIRKANAKLGNCKAFRVFGSSEVPLTTLGFVKSEQADLAAETDGEVVHYEVRIVDEDEQLLGVLEDGEIRVRGPAMFLGYADAKQTTESFDADGFFKTGDIGHLTAENAITITGRKKDLINRGGEKISAKEIEDILHRNPVIEEAAVIAIPHARLGETVGVYVILKKHQRLTKEDLIAHMLSSDVAKQKYPERLEIVDSFPRTASGKIRKDLLRLHARTTE